VPPIQGLAGDQDLREAQAGLLNGKSVGFPALKKHAPSSHEIAATPDLANVRCIIDEWLLLEYACTFLPCNQDAIVQEVSKGRKRSALVSKAGNLDPVPAIEVSPEQQHPVLAITTEAEIRRSIERQINAVDFEAIAQRAVHVGIDRARGRV
jgi:hypothetical protein